MNTNSIRSTCEIKVRKTTSTMLLMIMMMIIIISFDLELLFLSASHSPLVLCFRLVCLLFKLFMTSGSWYVMMIIIIQMPVGSEGIKPTN